MKKRIISIIFGMAALSFVLFNSCEIGLGSAVDTEPPSLEITNPPVDSIVRGSFALSGSWKDDGEISEVKVKLSRTDGKGSAITANATLVSGDGGKGNWSAVFNPEDGTILDGSYEALIEISDKAGHKTSQTRTFAVDNTAPLIVLQRPGTKITETPDAYGQTFSLNGMGADDNSIDHIDINIYSDAECTNLLKTITKSNVPPTIELDVAVFEDGVDNDYAAIYGSATKNGAQIRYCTITAYDNAQSYPATGEQTDADKKGNSTTNYYLYDDIYDTVLDHYTITDVYKMLSGTYLLAGTNRSADTVSNVKSLLNQYKIEKSNFSLDPENNPQFIVNGRDPLTGTAADFEGTDYNISSGTSVVIEVATGLDGIPLEPASLRPYLLPCIPGGFALADGIDIPENRIYLAEAGSGAKSGTSYKFTVNFDHTTAYPGEKFISLGNAYIIRVEGHDKNGNTIRPKGGSYGFKLTSNGAAPGLQVTSPAGPTAYVKANGSQLVAGTVTCQDGFPTITIKNGTETVWSHTFTAAECVDVNGIKQFNFSHALDYNGQTVNSQIQYTLDASLGDLKTTTFKTIIYDKDAPVIDGANILPLATRYFTDATDSVYSNGTVYNEGNPHTESGYLNGTVTLRLTINDEYDAVDTTTEGKKPYFEVIEVADDNSESVLSLQFGADSDVEAETTATQKHYIKKLISGSFKLNTNQIQSGEGEKKIKFKVYAWDKAGNANVYTYPEATSSTPVFKVNQLTDKPVILPASNDLSLKYTTKQARDQAQARRSQIPSGGQLLLTLLDDDGIAGYKIYKIKQADTTDTTDPLHPVYATSEEANTYFENHDVNEVAGNDSTQLPVSEPADNVSGYYWYKLWVKDNIGNITETAPFIIKVTTAAPRLVSLTIEETDSDAAVAKYVGGTGSAKTKWKNKIEIDSSEGPFYIYRKEGSDFVEGDYPGLKPDSPATGDYLVNEIVKSKLIWAGTNASSTTQYDIIQSPDANKNYYYIVLDNNWNNSNSKNISREVDKTIPSTLTIDKPTANAFISGTSDVFTGEARDADAPSATESKSGISKLYYKITNSNAIPAAYEEPQTITDGRWNINVNMGTGASELAEGTYWLHMYAEDAAGNKKDISARKFFVDQSVPTLTKTNTSAYYKKNENASITFTANDTNGLTAEAINVTVKKNGAELDTTAYAENGITWASGSLSTDGKQLAGTLTFTTNGSYDGVYEVTARATDIAARISEPVTFTTTIDGTIPVFGTTAEPELKLGGQNWSTSYYSTTNQVVSGAYTEALSGVKYLYYWIGYTGRTDTAPTNLKTTHDGTVSYFATANTFSFDATTLKENKGTSANTIYIQAEDAAGNLSDITSREINIDKAAPELTSTEINEYYKLVPTGGTQPSVTFTAKDTNSVSSLNVTVSKKNASGNYVALSDTEKSAAGITVSPVATSTVTEEGVEKSKAEITVTFTADGAAAHEGCYKVEASASDPAGKTTTLARTTTIDATAPVWNGNLTTGSGTNPPALTAETYYRNSTLKVNGAYTEASSGLETVYYRVKQAGITGSEPTDLETSNDGTATVSGNNFTMTLDTLVDNIGDQANVLYIQAVDKAGNKSGISNFTVNLDSTAPTVNAQITAPAEKNSPYNENTSVNFVAEDALRIGDWTIFEIKKNGIVIAESAYGTNGITISNSTTEDNKSRTRTVALTYDGEYTITARAQDAAGNTAESKSVSFEIDKTAPVFTASSLQVRNAAVSASYYQGNTQSVSGSYSESGSGMDTLYYYVKAPGSNTTVPPNLSAAGVATGEVSFRSGATNFNFTLEDLHDNINDAGTTVYFQAKDVAGNLSTRTNFSLNIDTTAPTLEKSTVNEYYKKNDTATVTFTAEDTNKMSAINVTVKKDSVVIDSANYSANGITWTPGSLSADGKQLTGTLTFTTDGSHDGKYEVTATASDVAGKTSTAVTFTTTIDGTIPVFGTESDPELKLGGQNWSPNYYATTNQVVSGVYTDTCSKLKYVYYWIGYTGRSGSVPTDLKTTHDGTVSYFATANTFSFDATTLKENKGASANTIYIQAEDAAGNLSAVTSREINIDKAAPELTSTAINEYYKLVPAGGTQPSITFTAKDTNNVASLGVVVSKKNESGTYDTLNATALATAGITVSPVTTSTVTEDGVEKSKAEITVTFTADEDAAHEGCYKVEASASDPASKTTTLARTTTIDATAPVLNVNLTTGSGTNALTASTYYRNSTLKVNGVYTEASSGLETVYYWVKHVGREGSVPADLETSNDGTATVSGNSFTMTLDTLRDNTSSEANVLYIQAVDKAGNKSGISNFTVNLDSTAPEVTAPSVTEFYNADTSLNFVASDALRIGDWTIFEIKMNGSVIAESAYGTNGITISDTTAEDNKSRTRTVALTSDGKYTITARVQDAAGNTSESKSVSFEIDKTAPVFTASTLQVGNSAVSTSYYTSNTQRVSGSYSESGSGMDTLYYYVKAPDSTTTVPTDLSAAGVATGEVSFRSGATNFSFTLEDLHDNINNVGTTVYFQAKDVAGNLSTQTNFSLNIDTTAPEVDTLFYKIGSGDPKPVSGTIYAKTNATITVYGNYKDLESGVQALSNFKIGNTVITPTVAYSTTALTDNASSIPSNFEITSAPADSNNKTIRSWKAEFSANTAGAFTFIGKNVANNPVTVNPFKITIDDAPPTVSNISITPSSNTVAYKKTIEGTEYYFVNNKNGTTFTFAGVAADNIGVEKVNLTIKNSSNNVVQSNDVTTSEWSFANINLYNVTGGTITAPVKAIITITDVAGNDTPRELNLVFDTTAPRAMHWADSKNKDVYFRIGNADNERKSNDYNKVETGEDWDEDLDVGVGSKYAFGSYGNDSTIELRGTFEETGSGLKAVHYKIFSVAPNSTEIDTLGTLENPYAGDIAVIADETRRVPYNETATTKALMNVTSNFRGQIAGFNEENNYLVLVAEDNVGNLAVDTLAIYGGPAATPATGDNKWNSADHSTATAYFSLNKDTRVPGITSTTANKSTNGTTEIEVTGTVSDTAAGVKSVTVSIDETINSHTITYTAEATVTATSTENEVTKAGDWTVTIPAETFNVAGVDAGSITVYATAKDYAGAGNTKTISAATVIIDKLGPELVIENDRIKDADTSRTEKYVNGTINITGTAYDPNGLRSEVTNAQTLKMYYTTAEQTANADGTYPVPTPPITKGTIESSEWVELTNAKTAHSANWTISLDTTAIASGITEKTVYLIVEGYDAAGNVGYSAPIKVIVDQDTDRPVITLTNIDLTVATFADNVIYGNVADDDGVPSSIRYYIGNTAPTSSTTWTAPEVATVQNPNPTFTYANGSFKLKLDDGSQKIWFKVNDGTNDFVSSNITSYTETYSEGILSSIKVVDSQAHKYGYRPESGETTSTSPSFVATTIDTTSPFIDSLGWSYHVTTGTPTWQSINTKPTAGGTGSKKEIDVRVYAYDVNGVNTVKLKLPKDSSDDASTVSGYSTAAADADPAYYIYNFTPAEDTDSEKTITVNNLSYIKWTSATIKATGMASGIRECKLEVFDGAKTTTETISITIDNTPADFEFTNYTDNQTVYGIKDIEVQGSVTANDKAHVYYYLTDDSVTDPADAKSIIDSHHKEITFESTRLNSVIKFDGDTTAEDATHEIKLRDWLASLYGITDINAHDDTEIVKLWVYVVDTMENSSVPIALSLNVIPNGDKPVINITYPGAGLKLGGTIRFSGETTIETSTVDKVYAQILVPEATASNWESKLNDWLTEHNSAYATGGSEQVYTVVDIDTNTRGIAVSGTPTSWNFAINSRGELEKDVEADEEPPSFTLNFIAKSASGKLSDVTSRTIQIDKNAPSIGVDIPLQLVKFDNIDATDLFADSNITARVTYTEDMWISGVWYLIGDVKDSNGVKELTWKDGDGSTATTHTLVERIDTTNTGTIKEVDNVKVQQSTQHSTPVENSDPIVAYDYKFAIKIGHTGGHGSISYTISAVDATAQNNRVDRTIKVNYDCTPPRFKATENSSDAASELSATGNKVQNSSGMYSVYGTFDEEGNQSGFKRIAMYFTRTINDSTNIVDPLVTKDRATGTNDKHNNYYSTGFSYISVENNGDGIYWKELTGGSTSNDTITISSIPAWVRVGGLCKVDGVIYKIKTVTASALTVDGTLASSDNKTVYVSPALVIDNLSSESKKQGQTYNGLYQTSADTSVINSGDGDWLIEGVSQQSSSYPWTASLNSQNMLDGPVTIHFVAFDKAGNATEKSYSGNVANNAPRLAGVTVWTDYNGNGKGWRNSGDHAADYEDETKSRYYSRVHPIVNNIAMDRSNAVTTKLIASGNQNDAEGIAATSSTAFMKVTDTVKFIPEIVGGNGALNYVYKIGKKAAFTVDTTTKEVTGFTESTTAGSKTKKSSAKAAITKDDGTAVSGTDVGQDVPTTSDVNSVTYVTGNTEGVITFDGQEILGALDNSDSNAPTWFDVIISDSTEGDTKLSCEMQVALQIHYHDVTSPVVKIRPFYWNSLTENSVYKQDNPASFADLKGHIELEGDLPTSFEEGGSGVNDRDPKVSGIIKVEGYAYDDIKLSELWVQMSGHTNLAGTETTGVKVAEYDGSWTPTAFDATTGWGFSATDVYCNSNGHLVKWTLTVDTAKRDDKPAEAEQTVVVYAVDARDSKTSIHDERTQTSLQSYRWGAVKNQENSERLYYEDVYFYRNASKTDTSDNAMVYKVDTWGSVKNLENASTTYYTDFYGSTHPTNATADETIVYKNPMTYYYKMDIVPYVTKVETGLSKHKNSNWSVYNRTALGHYPVQSVVTNAGTGINLKTTTSENVTLYGFNLNHSSVTFTSGTGTAAKTYTVDNANTDLQINNSTAGQLKFNVANLQTGILNLTVNNIPVMNNSNNNDAKGTANEAGNSNANYYNLQPNGDTNNIQNDDVEFDVWEFNDRAAVPINGLSTGICMEVNQKTGMLNYSFANGGTFYSMGGNINKTVAYDADNSYSSIYWAGDWDTFAGPCVGFHVDELGYTYSVDSGGDTNSSGSADNWILWTSRWGRGNRNENDTINGASANRLEKIALRTGTGIFDYSLMKYRYLSPEFASTVSGNNTNLYLVYYDALTNEIRFRAGTFSGTTKQSVGGFVDQYTNASPNNVSNENIGYVVNGRNAPDYYRIDNCQVIATSGESVTRKTRTGGVNNTNTNQGTNTTYSPIANRGAGQYVDVAVVKNGTTDVVCVVWYDAEANACKYSYISNPIGNWDRLKGDATAASWSTPKTVFSEGGEYCHIVADKNNHLHIAAYAGNGDVKYAYISTYNAHDAATSTIPTCTVDASGAVGEHLTLDVAVNSKGHSIPYIGYYTSAIKMPKYAFLVDPTVSDTTATFVQAPAGVDLDERFTGAWEATIVPSPSRMTTNREDKVNIGVWKNAGELTNSTSGTSLRGGAVNGYSSTNWSKTFGNGTSNAVLGYQISTSSGSCLETAQMR